MISNCLLILPEDPEMREISNNLGYYIDFNENKNEYLKKLQQIIDIKPEINIQKYKEYYKKFILKNNHHETLKNLKQRLDKHNHFIINIYPNIMMKLDEFRDKNYKNYIENCRLKTFHDLNQYYRINLDLGMSHYRLKNYKKGKYHFKIARSLYDNFQINLNIALLEFDANNKKEFIRYSKLALDFDFNIELACKLALEIYYENFIEAYYLYKKIINIDPKCDNILANIYPLYIMVENNIMEEKNNLEEKLYQAIYSSLQKNDIHNLLCIISNLQITNLYMDNASEETISRKAKELSDIIPKNPVLQKISKRLNLFANKKPMIGFILSDLKKHPVGNLLHLIIMNYNSDLFDICIYDNTDQSIQNNIIKSDIIQKVNYRCIFKKDNETSVKMIVDDNLDILIEMMGYTGFNRMDLFKYKLAKIMVSYFAYPFTTGMDMIDYKIVDRYTSPVENQKLYTEKFLYLPNCLQCYKSDIEICKNYDRNDPYTIHLCCFNNPNKITPSMIKTFSQILIRAPHAKLFLMYCLWYNNSYYVKLLKSKFENFGVDPNQVEITVNGDPEQYMKRYNDMDIALDPFPYNGGITSHEALYMNTPLIALKGRDYRSRVGISLLSNLNLEKYIAKDLKEYIEITIELMNNKKELYDLHLNLRSMMEKTDLCNARTFTKNFQDTLLAII
jgi:predicted O-linked N-acetylglucosamine transferase (SPINDLY family)